MKRLKPLNDFVFKKLFGENRDKDILIGFLNAVLETDVTDLYVLEEKLTKDKIDDKQGILDIKAACSSGEKINIEVQLANEHNIVGRTLFYWSKNLKKKCDKCGKGAVILIASSLLFGKLAKHVVIVFLSNFGDGREE